jgi:hypothetical protein
MLKESLLARPAKEAPIENFLATLSETEEDLTNVLNAPDRQWQSQFRAVMSGRSDVRRIRTIWNLHLTA